MSKCRATSLLSFSRTGAALAKNVPVRVAALHPPHPPAPNACVGALRLTRESFLPSVTGQRGPAEEEGGEIWHERLVAFAKGGPTRLGRRATGKIDEQIKSGGPLPEKEFGS